VSGAGRSSGGIGALLGEEDGGEDGGDDVGALADGAESEAAAAGAGESISEEDAAEPVGPGHVLGMGGGDRERVSGGVRGLGHDVWPERAAGAEHAKEP